MRSFILRIIVFIAIFVLFDRLCGYFLQTQRPIDYKLFIESKIEFFKKDKNVDMLVIGDSHIADAIDPRTIENNLSIKAYNLGIYHSSPFENYYITKAAIKKLKEKPKVIVFGTNPIMFERNLSKGKYTPLILPYFLELVYNSQEGFDKTFFLRTLKEKYLFKRLLNNLTKKEYKPTRIIEDVYRGHLKFFNQIPDTKWHNFDTSKRSNLNKKQVEYFSKTIELALKNNISVIIVHPPIWKEHFDAISSTESYNDFRIKINEITTKYNLKTYYNYLDNEIFDDTLNLQKRDYLNTQHLNYYGSEKFTKGFSDFLIKEEIFE